MRQFGSYCIFRSTPVRQRRMGVHRYLLYVPHCGWPQRSAGDALHDGRSGLSSKTLRNLHNMLHKALDQACRNNLIARNVTEGAVLPKRVQKEMRVLSKAEQRALLGKAFTERLGIAILLALSTGMRIGELCGLKWQDMDFMHKTLKVRRSVQRMETN